MIINKLNEKDTYQIKLIGQTIDIYNPLELEKITKKIFQKILKNIKTSSIVFLDFYTDKQYGTIIILNNYPSLFNIENEIEVKITIHTDTTFLYQIDYFILNDIHLTDYNIYYHQNHFYLKLNRDIDFKDYLTILELSKVIYENSFEIIDKGIKLIS